MRWLGKILSFILIDQLSKFAVSKFGWSIFFNDQFAFSLPVPTVVMFVIYVVVLVMIVVYVSKSWERFDDWQRWAWALVFAGGLSNVGERIITGHVKDFIPIASGMLNLADFYILAGLVLLLIHQRRTLSKL